MAAGTWSHHLKRRGNDEGLTLPELLVVIMVISALAAIAIPVFLKQRDKAQDGVAASDLHSVATAMEAYLTDTGQYGTAADVLSQGESPKVTQGTTVVVVQLAGAEGYCLAALRNTQVPSDPGDLSADALRWFDSQAGGLQNAGTTSCPKTTGVATDWQTDVFSG